MLKLNYLFKNKNSYNHIQSIFNRCTLGIFEHKKHLLLFNSVHETKNN